MKKLLLIRGISSTLLVCALTCVGLISCQKQYEPMDEIQKLADKNIPGTYSYIEVDTAKMQTKICEYVLKADGTGTYRDVVAGDQTTTVGSDCTITWTRGGYVENNVWVEINVVFSGESGKEPVTIKWGSAALNVGGSIFSKGSYIDNVDKIYDQFANHTFAKADSTFFLRVDTIADTYLEWNQAKGDAAKLTQAQIDELNAYFAQQWVKDTIAWYNKNHLAAGKKPIPDSVSVGKKSGDKFICVYYIGTETTDFIPVPVRLAEKSIDCNQFHFDREGKANLADYTYHFFEQDSAHFVNPAEGYVYDSISNYAISSWCISKPSSTGAFELLCRGTNTIVVNGVEKQKDNDYVRSFSVVGFYAGEEVTIDGVKHLYVK